MQARKEALLILDDGSRFAGYSFGYDKAVAGEVVFNTAMTGYPESLTDPSYAGQLMVLTYPLVGNYGVPRQSFEPNGISTFLESEKIHAEAIVVSDYSDDYSHWNASESLTEWLRREKIAGITGIDTRTLTKLLREKGSMKGKIVFENDNEIDFIDINRINQVARVSCKKVITYGKGKKRVVLVDCGVKHNIIRCLLRRDVTVIRVPWDYDFTTLQYDGLFISNGPGDPDMCDITVAHIREAMKQDKPIFGIC
ncbi:MAG: carbamoyl phosphate synthase small subunit, partial [Bacteroidaceae bacterium]|nr:carbamoyl phosphate synthase small subunit [Bacteroidaceae bacterium]